MIFYESFYEAAKYLSPEDKSAFLNAVLEYGCEGKVPELKGVPMAIRYKLHLQIMLLMLKAKNS